MWLTYQCYLIPLVRKTTCWFIPALQTPAVVVKVAVRSGGRSTASRFCLFGKCWCRKMVAELVYQMVGPG